MAAAQAMMANGGMERLMSNPAVANMVSLLCYPAHPLRLTVVKMSSMQSGGGMPDMSQLMNDPSIREM
jgi:small glutamine-rich tetratricopeptide repeat-containing protein alpha